MHIFTRPHVRTALVALGAMVAGALIALSFTLPPFQSKAGAAPPRVVEQRSVGGVCSTVVTGYGGELWAAPLGGGQLVRVDPAAVGLTGCRVDPDPNRR